MRLLGFLGLLSLLTARACGGAITAESSVDDVLDALDARGKDLSSFTADVKLTHVDPNLGDPGSTDVGHAYYQDRGNGGARFRVLFDQKITGKRSDPIKHDFVYTDGTLTDRDYHLKQQRTRQVLKPGEKMQIFKLEGPFPLPLGQDKADVHKRFDVKKLPTAKDEPSGTIHLQFTPLAATDLSRKFKQIDLWVDPKTSMPSRIDALDADATALTQTVLDHIQVGVPLKDGDFQMESVKLEDGWNAGDEQYQR